MSRTLMRSRARRAALASIALALSIAAPALAESPSPSPSGTDDGSVWWSELVSANPDKAREFYAGVIGWTPKIVAADDSARPPAPGEASYTLFTAHGTEQAGLSGYELTKPNEPRPGWLTYIQVGNVDTAVVQATQKGGKVLKAPTDADNGRIAIIQDPDGNAFGLFSPQPKQEAQAAH
ncbi:MAG: VOC family protein [Hyphomicrobium sp.]